MYLKVVVILKYIKPIVSAEVSLRIFSKMIFKRFLGNKCVNDNCIYEDVLCMGFGTLSPEEDR